MSFETLTLIIAAENGSCVARWLEGLGMGDYSEIFQKHEITMNDLKLLSAENVKELGFTKVTEAISLSIICLNHRQFNLHAHTYKCTDSHVLAWSDFYWKPDPLLGQHLPAELS